MWSGYPLQFGGQRRFGWQDQMAAGLQAALAGLAVSPGDVLSGTFLSTDTSRCDVENRLFTNPGTSVFANIVRSIRLGRDLGPPPEPPAPVGRVGGQSAGNCTTTATAWAGHGSGGNPPRRWRAGTG